MRTTCANGGCLLGRLAAPRRWQCGACRGSFEKIRRDPSDLTDLSDHERYALYARWLDHADPPTRANALICLIHQANYLLDRQIAALEKQFVEGGGYSEQLAAARIAHRNAEQSPDPNIPKCPQCDALMALRTAKTGKNCTKYPECKGTAKV